MPLTFNYMERMVGALILLTLLVGLATLAMVGQGKNWFRKHHYYHLYLSHGYDLDYGDKVKFLTTEIGEVANVSLTPENRVEVGLRVLSEYASRLKTDSVAVVRASGLIGNNYISISPGSAQAAALEPGREIPVKEVKGFSEVLEEFPLEKLLTRVENTVANVEQTSASVARIMAGVEQGQGSLGRLVRGEELFRQISALLTQTESILAKVESIAAQAEPDAGQMLANAQAASRDLPVITGQVRTLLGELEAIADQSRGVLKQVSQVVGEMPELTRQGRETIQDVREILDSVKGNFLIRGGLPPEPTPSTVGRQLRAE